MGPQMIVALGFWLWQIHHLAPIVSANAVFEVEHKFKGRDRSLSDFKAHDDHRHGRNLDDIDFPLGGNGNPTDSGLYFTKIRLGTPPHDYHVQVDTGSDILWVNCDGCDKCPTKSDIGVTLARFDPKSSNTSKEVNCDAKACTMIYSGTVSSCKPKTPCYYKVTYGDGSESSGSFVEDLIYYDEVTGNLQTKIGNASVVFGCGSSLQGQLTSSGEALDGIIGFGQADSSVLSQLSAAKKVKKVFSHCLDGNNGGGIFAIGEVVEPKMNTTPLVPLQAHYNVVMKSVEVGGETLQLPITSQAAIIDSGTTLAYVPDAVYQLVMEGIASKQPKLSIFTVENQFKCFDFSGNIDQGFPTVKFHFTESLIFNVFPREYLFDIRDDTWCIGWQNSGEQSKDGGNTILLGDMVLSNKLVMYDLENEALGWTDYNCATSIKVNDGGSEAPSSVGAHKLSSAHDSASGSSLALVVVLITIVLRIINLH